MRMGRSLSEAQALFLYVFIASLLRVAHASVGISEVFFRQTRGNQPNAFLELYNGGDATLASYYQVCIGESNDCLQLRGGIWEHKSYIVLCSDVSSNVHCREGLSFVLMDITSLELRDSNGTTVDRIEMREEAIPKVSYQRLTLSEFDLVPMAILSPGSGYLGGPRAPITKSPLDVAQVDAFFISEYDMKFGWVKIAYSFQSGSSTSEYALTIYDSSSGRMKYTRRITEANIGLTINGITLATLADIPLNGENFDSLALSGDGVVWDMITYGSAFVAINGPAIYGISEKVPFLQGKRIGNGCANLSRVKTITQTIDMDEAINCFWQKNGQHVQSIVPSYNPSVSPTMNRCVPGMNYCHRDSECRNVPTRLNNLGYVCTCKRGFEGDGYRNCVDVNECKTGNHNCDPIAECIDMDGSYKCACPTGHSGNGERGNCIKGQIDSAYTIGQSNVPSYSPSISLLPSSSSTIDRCAPGMNFCHRDSECWNVPPSSKNGLGYVCKCKRGYMGDGYWNCVDVNECKTGNHNCDPMADCVDMDGSYKCVCPTGYGGNGEKGNCIDIIPSSAPSSIPSLAPSLPLPSSAPSSSPSSAPSSSPSSSPSSAPSSAPSSSPSSAPSSSPSSSPSSAPSSSPSSAPSSSPSSTPSSVPSLSPRDLVIYPGAVGSWGSMKEAPIGYYGCGAQLRSEADQGDINDDTAGNGLRIKFCRYTDWNDQVLYTIDIGLFGDWKSVIMCNSGTYIIGGRIQFESAEAGGGDITALNGLKIQCADMNRNNRNEKTVYAGTWGDWTSLVESDVQFVTGAKTRLQSDQGGDDDTALNGIQFQFSSLPSL